MPTSPSVKFVVKNDNVAVYTPLMGVSTVLARTKKGPFNDSSILTTNLTQFRDIYGEEIVPDGSVSNIEKALSLGSKLRIIRVPGSGYYSGLVYTKGSEESTPAHIDVNTEVRSIMEISGQYQREGFSKSFNYTIGFRVKLYSELVTSPIYTVKWTRASGLNTLYCLIVDDNQEGFYSTPVITIKQPSSNAGNVIDYNAFSNFLVNNPYFEPVVLSGGSLDSLLSDLGFMDGNSEIINFTLYNTENESSQPFGDSTSNYTSENLLYQGYNGTTPGKDDWIASLQNIKNDTESYQVILSHLSQVYHGELPTEGHLKWSDALLVYTEAANIVKELEEFVLYVEIPKFKAVEGMVVPMSKSDIVEVSEALIGTLGNSKYIAYFGGGIKYYNSLGVLTSSDVLGTVAGLGDASANDYGPWRSFAGLNRGVIYDGRGPVSINYGTPARYDDLNTLAEHYVNMIVVKNTYGSGNQTVLWHCFTTQVKPDSFKFLSVVRLVLYLKKTLRPILDKYIEEPNIWNTWSDIYYEVKPILDSLITQRAMSEYEWMGDQFATSYKDLQINNEADVRQGKYKVVLKFKEVVPMQDITVVLYIDKVNNNISVEAE